MKKNFNLRTFLSENKLTANSKSEVSEADKGLRVSMGSNAEQEQRVIDIARDAIALMDEQPGTSAEDALAAVLDI